MKPHHPWLFWCCPQTTLLLNHSTGVKSGNWRGSFATFRPVHSSPEGFSSESYVNISLSSLLVSFKLDKLLHLTLAFPIGTLLLITASGFGECLLVWVWCFLLIPFRFCIFGWNSTEGGLSSSLCVQSNGGQFQFVPLPVIFTFITWFWWFLPGFSTVKPVSISIPWGGAWKLSRCFCQTFSLFICLCQYRLTVPHLVSRLSSFIICLDAQIVLGLAIGSPLRPALVSLSDTCPLFV